MVFKKREKRVYRKKPKVQKSSKPSKAFASAVKKVINRTAEKKIYFAYAGNQSFISASSSVPASKYLLPQISTGSTKSTRIGNSIRVTKAFIRGHLNLLPYNAVTNPLPMPMYVKLWVCAYRASNTATMASTDIATGFFDVNASTIGFQGNMLDMSLTPNKETWHVYATKTFKLGASYSNASSPVSSGSYFDNSPMSVPFYFDYTKHLSILNFDDGDTVPINRNMFLVFQAVSADGQSSGVYTMAEYHYAMRIEYVDY